MCCLMPFVESERKKCTVDWKDFLLKRSLYCTFGWCGNGGGSGGGVGGGVVGIQ